MLKKNKVNAALQTAICGSQCKSLPGIFCSDIPVKCRHLSVRRRLRTLQRKCQACFALTLCPNYWQSPGNPRGKQKLQRRSGTFEQSKMAHSFDVLHHMEGKKEASRDAYPSTNVLEEGQTEPNNNARGHLFHLRSSTTELHLHTCICLSLYSTCKIVYSRAEDGLIFPICTQEEGRERAELRVVVNDSLTSEDGRLLI